MKPLIYLYTRLVLKWFHDNNKEEGDKTDCESNQKIVIIIITITFRNEWLGTPMGGWEQKTSESIEPFKKLGPKVLLN